MYTDASDHCVGAILVQRHEDGIEHVIQYYSHQLSEVQQRWSTLEREAYAILSAVSKLRPYLLGSMLTVYTDHRPLVSLFSKTKLPNAKLQCWALILAEYNPIIKYHKGQLNSRADLLSRPTGPQVAVIDVDHEWVDPMAYPV